MFWMDLESSYRLRLGAAQLDLSAIQTCRNTLQTGVAAVWAHTATSKFMPSQENVFNTALVVPYVSWHPHPQPLSRVRGERGARVAREVLSYEQATPPVRCAYGVKKKRGARGEGLGRVSSGENHKTRTLLHLESAWKMV
jgi:hypothetical protein